MRLSLQVFKSLKFHLMVQVSKIKQLLMVGKHIAIQMFMFIPVF